MKLMFAVGAGYVTAVLLVLLNFIGVFTGKTILAGCGAVYCLIRRNHHARSRYCQHVCTAHTHDFARIVAVGIALLHDRRVEKKREKALAEDAVV